MRDNKNLCIKQSDKGKQTIIMDKDEFNEMTNIFIEKALNNKLYIYEEIINEDKAHITGNREIARLRRKVCTWKEKGLFIIRNQKNISQEETYWNKILDVSNHIPYMQFVVKTHKEDGLAVRNIWPKCNTWTQKLSKVIADTIEDAIRDNFLRINYIDTNIKNIEKFASNLQGQHIKDNEEITSIDIKEMFNKIDQDSLIDIIRRYINGHIYNVNTLIDMISYDIQKSNWVIYNRKIYKQNQGIPMGASTSSIYAKIYLDYYITLNWKELKKIRLIKLYKYVDDLLIINEKNTLDQIINLLNNETKLEHKTVSKPNKEIEYLDIIINIDNGIIQTRKYKKSYASNRTINAKSAQSWNTKNATITNRFQRSFNLSSACHLYNVLQQDIEVILNNGFNLKHIGKLLNAFYYKNKELINNNTLEETKKEHNLNKLSTVEECMNTIRIQKEQIKKEDEP